MRPRLLRVAICADFLQEQWPSMDRVAWLLYEELRRWSRAGVIASLVRPPFERRLTRVPLVGRTRTAFSGDRFMNRFWRYPQTLERLKDDFDVFHIVDHSYAHLRMCCRGTERSSRVTTSTRFARCWSRSASGDRPCFER